MQQADISFLNEPYYLVTIPEFKEKHRIDLHVHRYDVPGKGWKGFPLKYPTGSVQLKDVTDTSYVTVPHVDDKTEFKVLEYPTINIEKNIFQIKGPKLVDSTRVNIISDITKMLQADFTIYRYTLEEFEELLTKEENETKELAQRTLKAFQDVNEPAFKEDIARYYLLYTRGGVYLDPKAILKKRLIDKYFRLNLYDGFVVIYDNSQNVPEMNLMAFRKGSQLMKDVLEKAVTNVENRVYGNSSQAPTGALCFRECLMKDGVFSKTTREIKYGENNEKIFILRQEAGRLYDDSNRPLWNRDVCSNTYDRSLLANSSVASPNFWLHCRLYPDGNCSSWNNWKFYISERTDTPYLVGLAIAGVILVAILYFFFY